MIQSNSELELAKQLMNAAMLRADVEAFDHYYKEVCEYEERGIDVG